MELLEVITGTTTRTIALTTAKVTIGRGLQNDVVLDDDATASNEHATVQQRAGKWTIADRGSTNGTFVNGHQVQGCVDLTVGDRITIGKTTVMVTSDTTATAQFRFAHIDDAINAGLMRVKVSDRRLLRLLAQGADDDAIGTELGMDSQGVTEAIDDLAHRVGARRRIDLARIATKLGAV